MNSDLPCLQRPTPTSASLETNNQAISSAERDEILSHFRDTQNHLHQLNNQIDRLQAKIDYLLSMKKHDLARLKIYRKILAPHRGLPDELLSEIFIHCASNTVTLPPNRKDPLWILLHVCSRWRQVVLETPNLWKHITVDYNRYRYRSAKSGHLSLIKQLLLQTDFPLTLDLHQSIGIDLVKNLVVPNIHRLESLTLDSSESEIDQFFELPPTSAKILENVVIRVNRQSHVPLGPVTVFQSAQNLRRVTLKVPHFHPNFYRLPWAQLLDLHLPECYIHTDIGYAILSHCTSLEHCTLRLECESVVTTDSQKHPPLVLWRLSSIKAHIEMCNDYGRFFERFSYPRLSSFELIDKRAPQVQRVWDPRLIPIITRSPFLRKLSLWLPIQRIDIEPLFKVAGFIVELSIPCVGTIPKSTLAAISERKLLPRLTSLATKIDDDLGFHLDMVESRQGINEDKPSVAASYLFYVDRNWRDDDGERRLDMLVKKGFHVVLCRT